MTISLTRPRTFVFAAVAAYLGSVAFLVSVTRMDFPNSTFLETLAGSLLPGLPAALISGAIASHYVHREQLVDTLEWPTGGLLILGFVSAIAAIMITVVGAIVLGILGWAFANPI